MRARFAPGLLALAACGPVPVEQAERTCLEEARLAERPRGELVVGVAGGTGGLRPAGGLSVNVSADYLLGRSPEEVWQRCVLNRSGRLPTRPYRVR